MNKLVDAHVSGFLDKSKFSKGENYSSIKDYFRRRVSIIGIHLYSTSERFVAFYVHVPRYMINIHGEDEELDNGWYVRKSYKVVELNKVVEHYNQLSRVIYFNKLKPSSARHNIQLIFEKTFHNKADGDILQEVVKFRKEIMTAFRTFKPIKYNYRTKLPPTYDDKRWFQEDHMRDGDLGF